MNEYQDSDGNPMSLYRLVRKEPDWAVSRIDFMNKHIAKLEKENAGIKHLCDQVDDISINCTITDEEALKRILEIMDKHRDLFMPPPLESDK